MQSPTSVSTKLERIAKVAKQMRGTALTSLSHHIDIEWMHEAYRRTRKDAAAGVDGQTAGEYALNLESNLQRLLGRAKSGDQYRAPPVRRVHLPKGDGKTRPIGIPTFEDKILQRAVAMVMEAVYEQDFLNCSYGFRPGRSAHAALDELWRGAMAMGGGWVLEVDIESFFDTVDRNQLQQIVRQRIRDGVLLRLIGKWLNAGVMEEGQLYRPESGTPQGGVISPLLANVYLHEVMDEWFEYQVRPRLRGRAQMVRYADDIVVIFEQERDARRVWEVLPKRFEKYGLRLHPDKTQLIRFEKPDEPPDSKEGGGSPRPGSFDLLGFTHYWRRSTKGNWVIRRKTASKRFSRALQRMAAWCRSNRHLALAQQHRMLVLKLKGHYNYYGIIGNSRAIWSFAYHVQRTWWKWLARRSNAGMTWTRMSALMGVFPLPIARIVHKPRLT
jgi:group II intron reverse transcriptase/maturase